MTARNIRVLRGPEVCTGDRRDPSTAQMEKRIRLGDVLVLLLIIAIMAICFGVDWYYGGPVALFILALLILVLMGKL
jgi:hypothetical protein